MIESWRRFCPDYEIKEWNESNFDVNIIPYTRQAYEAKKYAFVSDYARMWILYHHGGVYFDTDVEVIRPIDDIIAKGGFMGCEIDGGDNPISVNPGLGIASAPGNAIYADILNVYSHLKFHTETGDINMYAIVRITTDVLKHYGLKESSGQQQIDDITIYPARYFNPMNSLTGVITITENTYSIHYYMNSWASPMSRVKNMIGKLIRRLKANYI